MGTALAVRLRPKTLDGIIGQDAAVKVVKRLIKEEKILGRGLLIYGPSGLGKTSLARIIAHYVNCERLQDCAPCGTCDYCQAVAAGTATGVEELNFSDARGIDAIRNISESLAFVSTTKARVIILDEAHGMTLQAANAFLKILEEPPENTVFILLTTEPHKVLETVRNRCVQIGLHKVDPVILSSHLKVVAKDEGVELPDYAYAYIARSSNGIVRQALSSLEVLAAIKKEDPSADLSNHHLLEDKLETDGANPLSIAGYLIGGIYMGSYGKALSALQRMLMSPSFNARFLADRLFEYHTQTFYCLVDPARQQKNLTGDFFADWYATLEQQVKKKGMFNLTVESGGILFDLLLELSRQLQGFELEPAKVLLAYTSKMVRAIKENSGNAYTNKSPFHMKHAKELCLDSN